MTRDVAASVRQRLLNRARAEGRPFNEVLQHFALERFLYRLGRSSYQHQFVLKGALMFTVWQSPFLRPTRDIDLLGRMENTIESVTTAIRVICQEPAPEDGLRFDTEGIAGERIVETGLWYLATHFPFDGPLLARAVRETFRRRGTALLAAPAAFGEAFARDEEKRVQWVAFIRRHQLENAPPTLEEAVQGIAAFLQPVVGALSEQGAFDRKWSPGGPWSPSKAAEAYARV